MNVNWHFYWDFHSTSESEWERAQRYGIKGDNMMWIKYTLWYSLANFTLWLWKAKQSSRWIERWKQHTQTRMRKEKWWNAQISSWRTLFKPLLDHDDDDVDDCAAAVCCCWAANRKRKSLRYLGGVTETLATLSRQSASVSYCYRKWLLRVKMNERWHCCANRSKQPLNHEFCLHVFTFIWTE